MNSEREYLPPPGSVDALVVFAHPDDEVCQFGGLLPYLVDSGRTVLAVCMTAGDGGPNARTRELELADSLWTCGLRYPAIAGGFLDCGYVSPGKFDSIHSVWQRWGGRAVVSEFIQGLYRQFRPMVVFTHNHVTGEYGHPAHRAAGMACIDAFDARAAGGAPHADPVLPAKIYECSWSENAWSQDWNRPLAAFSGQSGWQVASRALVCHRTQAIARRPLHTGQRTALVRSSVGPDVSRQDYFERCSLR